MSEVVSAEQSRWDAAVAKYEAIVHDNARARVALMTTTDLSRYSERHNTPTDSRDDVLAHMFRWGGFRELVMGGQLFREKSDLFHRLLNGLEPLPYPPPRYFKRPWFDLFDLDCAFEVQVVVQGRSQRMRDRERNIHVFVINDCPWECSGASAAGAELLRLNSAWVENVPIDGVLEANAVWAQCQEVLQDHVAFDMRFGRWESAFKLWLEPVTGDVNVGRALSAMERPMIASLFGATRLVPGFPLKWLLSR